jgi:branched-chain amino acid transport system permease protein
VGQVIVSGLAAGSTFALLALALVLVFKATNVPNFAQAEMGLLPAFITWQLMTTFHVGYALGVLAGIASGVVIAVVIERSCIRPILAHSESASVMMTIGLFFVLNSISGLVWDSAPRIIAAPFGSLYRVAGTTITEEQVVAIGVGVVVVVVMSWFFRTHLGSQMRALAEDRVTPRLVGVNPNRVFLVAWAIAGALSAIALLLATQSTVLNDQSGVAIILDGFVAATLGGFNSLLGAFVGGLVLGVLTNLAGTYVSTSGASAVALLIVFLVLMARPRGLFGQARAREV